MKQTRVASFVSLFLGLHFVVLSKANGTQFTVRIKERESRFNEIIRIDVKKNTVLFVVPKHNDVNRSEVLNDFNLNITVTRLPDVGLCHIKPLEKSLPHPAKLKSDMNFAKRANAKIRKHHTLVSSSEWKLDTRLSHSDLHPSVVKFCAGLPVYSLKENTDDHWEITPGDDTVSVRKRQADFKLCPGYSSAPCSPNKWILNCKWVVSGTCVYWMKCKFPIEETKNILDCNFTHNWSAVMCCYPASCAP